LFEEKPMSSHVPELAVITLIAAVVNGALGYGFSSITVPLALLFVSSRTLNPSLVLVEVALNGYVLWVNRDAVPQIRRRMSPVSSASALASCWARPPARWAGPAW